MTKRRWLFITALALGALVVTAGVVVARGPGSPSGAPLAQSAVGTGFTYQGRLDEGGTPADGAFDLRFALFDADVGGAQVGGIVALEDMAVVNGLFTVQLDFGDGVFTGDARWLEVAVRPGASTDAHTVMSPRQPLTPTPYALALPGLYTETSVTGMSPNIIGGWIGNFVTPGVVGGTIGGGGNVDVGFGDGPNRVTDHLGTVGGGWNNQAGDGIGTLSDAQFATVGGGHDNTASQHGATVGGGSRHENDGIDATIAGGLGNKITADFATIGGGGRSDVDDAATGNRVTDEYGTVGGGGNNQAGNGTATTTDAIFSTVGGGEGNTASDDYATVAGGHLNIASAFQAVVGGGEQNTASSDAATVSGGDGNTASGFSATVAGGQSNAATNSKSTVSGGSDNTASGDWATVAGGSTNAAGSNFATVGGGGVNTASGEKATVAGGGANTASGLEGATVGGGVENSASGQFTTVSGGTMNVASSDNTTVGGGNSNVASGLFSTIGGGSSNKTKAAFATIAGGGASDPASPATRNLVTDEYGTIGGGGNNLAGSDDGIFDNGAYATVGGGSGNTASGFLSTVGGGGQNTASSDAATVSGGNGNTASGFAATVGGGNINTASGSRSTVGGGTDNIASGSAATVPGGRGNEAAAAGSFAAGGRAKVDPLDVGAVLFGAVNGGDFPSMRPVEFAVGATGGFRFVSGQAAASSGGAGSTKEVASAGTTDMTWTYDQGNRKAHVLSAFAPDGISPIAFDSASSQAETLQGKTLAFSHTVGNSANPMLVVGVEAEVDYTIDCGVASVTYGGVPLAKADAAVVGSTFLQCAELWYLIGPNVGSANVVVTWHGVVDNRNGGAVSIFNAAQKAPEATATQVIASGFSITTSITTLTDGAWVVDAVGGGSAGTDLVAGELGQTERYDVVGITDSTITTGCNLPPGSGTWECTSDRPLYTVAASDGCEGAQLAIDDLPAAGGQVILQAGDFICASPIVVDRDNVDVRGQGAATVLRLADGANSPVFVLGQIIDNPVESRVNIRISDLTIDGNRANQTDECWGGDCAFFPIRNNGITARKVQDVVVQRVTVFGARSGGVVFERGSRRVTVRDLVSYDNQFDGLAAYETEDSIFSGLHLFDNLAAGLSFDLDFNNNLISDALISGSGSVGIFMVDSSDNMFHGLQIRNSAQHGIFLAHGADSTTAASGNTFSATVVSDSGQSGGFCVDQDTGLGYGMCVNNTSVENTLVVGSQFVNSAGGCIKEAFVGQVEEFAAICR